MFLALPAHGLDKGCESGRVASGWGSRDNIRQIPGTTPLKPLRVDRFLNKAQQ